MNLVWGIQMFSMILIRLFDFIISFFLFILFIPVIILIVLILFFSQGKPIFHISERVGLKGKKFSMYKFRTMSEKISKDEDDKITTFGKYLRRSSLDELPQLINILKNDMSFVGPRPLPINIENQLNPSFIKIRRSVKPGLTGYAQILYKKKKRSWDEKVKLDIIFIENFSIFKYLKILFLTFPVLVKRFLFNPKGDSL